MNNNKNKMKCITCGSYYRVNVYNETKLCNNCFQFQEEQCPTEEEIRDEIDMLQSSYGSTKTMPVFYSD